MMLNVEKAILSNGERSFFMLIMTIFVGLLANLDSLNASVVRIEHFSFKLFEEVDVRNQLTCFTCDKSRTNDECNRKAIDEPCQQKLINYMNVNLNERAAPSDVVATANSYAANFSCLTIHKFDAQTLKTIYVEKKCSADCRPQMVGCTQSINYNKLTNSPQNIQTCSYCCNRNYCNVHTVYNVEEAFNLTKTLSTSTNHANSNCCNCKKIYALMFMLIFSIINGPNFI